MVVTIAAARGSVPGETGNKAIVGAAGLIEGTLGGGRVEARAIEFASAMLGEGKHDAELVTWNLQQDIGMTCGGEMTFLFEPLPAIAPWHIVIFGAGHVAASLIAVLSTLKCRVDLIDPRPEWLEKIPSFRSVSKHQPERYEDEVGAITERSFVLCLTKGHATDRPVLRDVLQSHPNIAFVGAIGSASKRATLLRELREDGIAENVLEKLVCPLGLPIGSNEPAEIAVSISAQLLERRDRLDQ